MGHGRTGSRSGMMTPPNSTHLCCSIFRDSRGRSGMLVRHFLKMQWKAPLSTPTGSTMGRPSSREGCGTASRTTNRMRHPRTSACQYWTSTMDRPRGYLHAMSTWQEGCLQEVSTPLMDTPSL